MPNLLEKLNVRLKEEAKSFEQFWETPWEEIVSGLPTWAKATLVPGELARQAIKGIVEPLKRSMYTGEVPPEDALNLAMLGLGGSVPGGPVTEAGTTSLGMIKGRNSLKGLIRQRMIEERKTWGPKVKATVPDRNVAIAKVLERPDFRDLGLTSRHFDADFSVTHSGINQIYENLDLTNPLVRSLSNDRWGMAEATGRAITAYARIANLSLTPIPEIIDAVLRGTWWHGRHNYPGGQKAETLAGARQKELHLGEPAGISLSVKPEQAKRFAGLSERERAAKRKFEELRERMSYAYGRATERYEANPGDPAAWAEIERHEARVLPALVIEPRISRVLPLLGGPPAEKILPAWKGPGTEGAQKILREAYLEALEKVEPGRAREALRSIVEPQYLASDIPEALAKKTIGYGEGQIGAFNQAISDALKRRGYKGVLYSPERYKEYELKMLDAADVGLVDWRRLEKLPERYQRVFEYDMKGTEPWSPSRFKAWEKAGPTGHKAASLARIWEDISEEEIRGVLERVVREGGPHFPSPDLSELDLEIPGGWSKAKEEFFGATDLKMKALEDKLGVETFQKLYTKWKSMGISNEDIVDILGGHGAK